MDNMGKITSLIVFALVGTILTVAVGIPIFEDMSEIAQTETNDNRISFSLASDDREHTIQYVDSEKMLYIDGLPMLKEGETIQNGTVMFAGNAYIIGRDNFKYELWIAEKNTTGSNWTLTFTGKEYNYTTTGNQTGTGQFAEIPLFWNKNGDWTVGNNMTITDAETEVCIFNSGGTVLSTIIGTPLYGKYTEITSGNMYQLPSETNNVPTTTETIPITINATENENGTITLRATADYNGSVRNLSILAPIEYTWQEKTVASSIIEILPIIIILIILIGCAYGVMSFIKTGRDF